MVPCIERYGRFKLHRVLRHSISTQHFERAIRRGIINEDALFETLVSKKIAGAALDCFVGEPILTPHRFGELENVILAPHSIAWTHELFSDIGSLACQNVVDLAQGRRLRSAVNPEVFERPTFREKWDRLKIQ